MHIQQKKYIKNKGWRFIRNDYPDGLSFDLVLGFGSRDILSDAVIYSSIEAEYPGAIILLNSTAGEIMDTEVSDDTISLTAIAFEKTTLMPVFTDITTVINSYEAGRSLALRLTPEGLKYVLVIADGHAVNGSELVNGLQEHLPADTIITGGLAGDGGRFQKTLVGLNEVPTEGRIVAVGFYGDISVSYGSVGGWDSFGPERLITKSVANVLYELDGNPALDIYKMYLGEYADELPQSGLLFPLSIRLENDNTSIVRTILSVDPEHKSLTFAGNMPEGFYARLMKANLDRLIEGASDAAANSICNQEKAPDLALLISCVGRKLVLDQRIEEEVEVIRTIYGPSTAIAGFYSYGEISPSFNFLKCDLHNQTMTITTLREG